jgi:CSLREA domain-containing protein
MASSFFFRTNLPIVLLFLLFSLLCWTVDAQPVADTPAQPLALTTGDFNQDGYQDVVVGYAGAGSGYLTLFYRADSGSNKGALEQGITIPLPVLPQFVVTGDFDADGYTDVAAGAAGADSLYWIKGDRSGNFHEAGFVKLQGSLSALIACDIHRQDGLADVIALADANGKTNLHVFRSPRGAFNAGPEIYPLDTLAWSPFPGFLNDDPLVDLVLVSEKELLFFNATGPSGYDSRPSFTFSEAALTDSVTTIVPGMFSSGSGQSNSEWLALTRSGHLELIRRTAKEASFSALPLLQGLPPDTVLLRGRMSGSPSDDVLLLNGSETRMLTGKEMSETTSSGRSLSDATASVLHTFLGPSGAASVSVARLNDDALDDLVYLGTDSLRPEVLLGPTGITYTVNAITDDNGVCDATNCSLREAITAANANAGTDTIAFNIPGSGSHTITPGSALPPIPDAVIIDGTTQPGYAGIPLIEINGNSIAGTPDGLNISAGSSTVRGLVINRFRGDGIELLTNGGNLIAGNYVGTNLGGTLDSGNLLQGININNVPNNIVGGTAASDRNIISGNNARGISVSGASATANQILGNRIGTDVTGQSALANSTDGIYLGSAGNTVGGLSAGSGNVVSSNGAKGINIAAAGNGNIVQGNYIGVSASGTLDLGNTGYGVGVNSAANCRIGGPAAGAGNLISGNNTYGISMDQPATTGTLVQGNYIGTQADGTSALGNSSCGMIIMNSAQGNTTGGTISGAANRIAFNGNAGVCVLTAATTGNALVRNSIFSNTGIGIDLEMNGATLNDPGDPDLGGNRWQNYPDLQRIYVDTNGDLIVQYFVNSTSTNSTYPIQVEFYEADSFPGGEGRTYFTGDSFTTIDYAGGSKTANLGNAAALGVARNDPIVANSTDAAGNTSEFSPVKPVEGLATTYIVNTTDDANDGTCDLIHCSLREAIFAANANYVQDTISFNITSAAPHTIRPGTALPTITDPVIIDGSTNPDFGGTPVVELSGNLIVGSANGLTITAGNSTVKGLAINSFSSNGITLSSAGGNAIQDCYIGTDTTGTIDLGNTQTGVSMSSAGNTIGGTLAGSRNIISGNTGSGVFIGGTGNVVAGNYIGTTSTGQAGLGNGGGGISVFGASNTIGGTAPEAHNVISANVSYGIQFTAASATGNLVQGNYVGLAADGTTALGNTLSGIYFTGSAANNFVGNTAGTGSNLVAYNGQSGVYVSTGTGNAIYRNSTFSNTNLGIDLGTLGITANDAGDPDAGANRLQNFPDLMNAQIDGSGNLLMQYFVGSISGNSTYPLRVEFFKTSGLTTRQGKVFLGSDNFAASDYTAGSKTANLGNAAALGVTYNDPIVTTATDSVGNTSEFCAVRQINGIATTFIVNTTDDTNDGTCDASHCSLREAINAANFNFVTDTIAFNIPGSPPYTIQTVSLLPTITDPVVIDGTSEPDFSGTPIIEIYGNSLAGTGLNLQAGNSTVKGLVINRFNGDALRLETGNGNVIAGNYIGTNVTGSIDLGNTGYGIVIYSSNNTIGGTTPAARNVVSGNGNGGILLAVSSATGNTISGNYIGADRTGMLDVGNTGPGIYVSGQSNTIGGTTPAAGNVISGNDSYGIFMNGSTTILNQVLSNYIGVASDGTTAIGNGSHGIYVNQAGNNTYGNIAGTGTNVIANNAGDGIYVALGASGTQNKCYRNSIYANVGLGIDLGVDGVSANDPLDPDTGANNMQNFPTMSSAQINGSGDLIIQYLVNSATSNSLYSLRIEFYEADSVAGGEGKRYFATDTYTSANYAAGTKTVNFGNAFGLGISGGDAIVSTTTDLNGNTSEFSAVRVLPGVPSTFTVNSANDVDDGNCDLTHCSLREAILAANGNIAADVIAFNVAGSPPHTIHPSSPLPIITDPVAIDGSTDPHFAGTPVIELAGDLAGSSTSGLRITAGNSTVKSLVIDRFDDTGITIDVAGGNSIFGNYIGTDATGTAALPNQTYGITIWNGNVNTIGGTTPARRNIILGDLRIKTASDNVVQGNYLETDTTGTMLLQPTQAVLEVGSANNTIGGSASGTGNLMSNIAMLLNGNGNTVQGNLLGTDVTGALALGAGSISVGGNSNLIGGTVADARNVVAASNAHGISLSSGTSDNTIQGNYIGTDITGTLDLGSSAMGVFLDGSNNLLGGAIAGAGNLISGNGWRGVYVQGIGNRVQGNRIGTNASATAALPNDQAGIEINTATNTLIGGTSVEARNIVSGNSGDGIYISAGSGSTIQGNYIGLNGTGAAAIPNGGIGILVEVSSGGSTIGGAIAGAGNVISGNGLSGILIVSDGNTIQGNRIGTDASGVAPLGHLGPGVWLAASGNMVGGTAAGAGNVIAFNNEDGVKIDSGTGNAILGNSIFSNSPIGIDLNPFFATLNDAGDADSGTNNLQNFPTFQSAGIDGSGNLIVQYFVDSDPVNSAFPLLIQFFKADSPSPGQGKTYLASDAFTSADFLAGFKSLNLGNAAALGIAVQDPVVATATDAANNTSEFSGCPAIVDGVLLGEVPNLKWCPAGKSCLQWDSVPNVATYKVYRGVPGDLPKLLDSGVDSCSRWSGSSLNTGATLNEQPAAGSFYWYLTTAASDCGEGTEGNSSQGPRQLDSSGSCP